MIANRTMFQIGFQESPFRMSQADDQLAQADRDALLVKIDTAFRNAPIVDAFVAKGTMDKTLGPVQASKFRGLLAQAANIVGTVAVIQERLQSQVATDWIVDAVERQRVNDYAAEIDQMVSMINAQQTAQAAPKTPQAGPAAASGTILGMPPAVVYIGGTVIGLGLLATLLSSGK